VTGAAEQIELRDPGGRLQARFVPSAGMICVSLRSDGEELLAQRAGLVAYVERGKTMGIPLLYPWANRLAAPEYTAAGRQVALPRDPALISLDGSGLPIHGVIGGRLQWSAQQVGEERLSATLAWGPGLGAPFAVFPYVHEARYEATLSAAGLRIRITIRAGDEGPVPVAYGLHPYLTLPGCPRERWQVELPAMRCLELDERQIPVGHGGRVAARSFELGDLQFDAGFDELSEDSAFAVSGAGRRLGLSFEGGFTCAQVFAPAGSALICFEPMTAPCNALRSGDGLRLLAPGESHVAALVIAPADGR